MPLDLTTDVAGKSLQKRFSKAYEYSDCWIEDSKLVSLNARDAARLGARILTRTKVTSADRQDGLWQIITENAEGRQIFTARALVNAGGPWVEEIIRNITRINATDGVRRFFR